MNVEHALTAALKRLAEHQADRKVLLFAGDTGPSEFDLIEGISEDDLTSEARAFQALADFLRSNPNTRVVTA